jgi:CheY-like chemotaxis protein
MPGTPICLIVDDEPQVLVYLRTVLQCGGFESLEASNGAEALAVLRLGSVKVHVVLSDVSMPVMGGVELAATVRAEFPGLPIVLVSGYASIPVEDIPLLQKPFLPATLLGLLRNVLGQPRTASTGV